MLKTYLLTFAFFIGLGLIALAMMNTTFDVGIEEDLVNTQITNILPQTHTKLGGSVTISTLDVDFLETNTVNVKAEFAFKGYNIVGTGSTDITSGLRYQNGDFFLTDLTLDDIVLSLNDTSLERAEGYKQIGNSLLERGMSFLSENTDSEGQAVAEELTEQARLRATETIKTLANNAMTSIPVYSLNGKDIKYDLAKLALEDVTFTDTQAVATLNPGKAVRTLLLMGLVMVFSVLATAGWMFSLNRQS